MRLVSRWILLVLAITLACVGAVPAASSKATGTPPPGAVARVATLDYNLLGRYGTFNAASPDVRHLYRDPGGRVVVVSRDWWTQELTVETFDPESHARIAQRTMTFPNWPLWGGFYAAPDGHLFVMVGRSNPTEDPDLHVVAVHRYTPDWEPDGTALLEGGASQGIVGIYEPFDAGAAAMQQVGDRLVVHMPRTMFASADGVRHQASLTFEVDLGTMTASSFQSLGEYPYSSHSFGQLLAVVGDDLAILDHGDAFPRAIQVSVVKDYVAGGRAVESHDVFPFQGDVGDNYTGVAVTGMTGGASRLLVTGSAVPHDKVVEGETGWAESLRRNVFLISVDPASGNSVFSWVTRFRPSGDVEAGEPRIVQVGADRFVLLFTVRSPGERRMEYRLVDGSGQVLAAKSWTGAWFDPVSDPIVVDNVVRWVGLRSDAGQLADEVVGYLCGLDIADPQSPRLLVGDFPGTDARLRALKVTGGRLSPAFVPRKTGYVVRPRAKAKRVTLTASPRDASASVRMRVGSGPWKPVARLAVPVPARRTKLVRISVRAEDATSVLTYRVSVAPRRR
jgi:hypothetical protein